jgi:hypothetical protein
MSSKIAISACRRVSRDRRQISSTLMDFKKLLLLLKGVLLRGTVF